MAPRRIARWPRKSSKIIGYRIKGSTNAEFQTRITSRFGRAVPTNAAASRQRHRRRDQGNGRPPGPGQGGRAQDPQLHAGGDRAACRSSADREVPRPGARETGPGQVRLARWPAPEDPVSPGPVGSRRFPTPPHSWGGGGPSSVALLGTPPDVPVDPEKADPKQQDCKPDRRRSLHYGK